MYPLRNYALYRTLFYPLRKTRNEENLAVCYPRYLAMQYCQNKRKHIYHGDPNLKPFTETDENIWVGPPHPVSNIRLKFFPNSAEQSKEEEDFYTQSRKTQEWNHQYWEAHNKDFQESRKLFIEQVSKEKNISKDEVADSEEMAHFYEKFLKKNHSKHIRYNWDWYKKNFILLYLAAKANFFKFIRIFKK
ncbi:apoptogenic protein 1, mitochondrial [Trichonephila inaurata madagascariensis]|uniref:Apoptogenic protein 1, mitochondrial n=1 Tax=Trichonephila inaurata madagascariensis TaxID=2747483 RepID=A0A8X6XM82_9ARAC|nr:apoptogenic protein 1, mitochondrial [Trichonephila inaurata madagascariensis]